MNNNILTKTNKILDLGVLFDPKLTFNDHVDYIAGRANSMLGFIKRWAKELDDPYVTKSLFTTLVRPILEYACPVWSPSYKRHSDRIEGVQRRFLLFALRGLGWQDSFRLPPYVDRLKLIDLTTLHSRRKASDIVFIFRLLKGEIDTPLLLESICINSRPRNLRSTSFIYLPSHHTNYGRFEPITRMCTNFNANYDLIDFNLNNLQLRKVLGSSSLL